MDPPVRSSAKPLDFKMEKHMERNQPCRPEKVSAAIKLLYITLGIGALRGILEASIRAQMASPLFVISVSFGVFGVVGFFIYMIGRGRNWSRITFTVLFIIGLPFSVQTLIENLTTNPISGLLGIGQTVIQVIALIFLFQKTSSAWFKETRLKTNLSNQGDAPDQKAGR